MRPVTSSVATLAMPRVEKRSVAVRAIASAATSVPVIASSSASGSKRADPRRRGDQMQHVRRGMDDALNALAADGVAGPGQAPT